MAEKALYGVKLYYRYAVDEEVIYEESVLRLRAVSFDDAIAKAERYAMSTLDSEHINYDGKHVDESIFDVYSCYLIDEDPESEIEEVFSEIMKNRTSLSEEEYIDLLSDSASAEERRMLLYQRFKNTPVETLNGALSHPELLDSFFSDRYCAGFQFVL